MTATNVFLNGCRDSDTARAVLLSRPSTLQEALKRMRMVTEQERVVKLRKLRISSDSSESETEYGVRAVRMNYNRDFHSPRNNYYSKQSSNKYHAQQLSDDQRQRGNQSFSDWRRDDSDKVFC